MSNHGDSRRFFQGIDYQFKDVRAVVGNLLEDGVGVVLKLGTFFLTLFKLSVQLQNKS